MPKKRRGWWLALLMAFAVAAAVFLTRDTPPDLPAVTVLAPNAAILPPTMPRLERLARSARLGFWRIYARLAPRRIVDLEPEIFQFADSPTEVEAKSSLGPPWAQTNGVWVWIVAESNLESIQRAATNISMCGIQTSEGTLSTLSTGNSNVTIRVGVVARPRQTGTDLTVGVTVGVASTNRATTGLPSFVLNAGFIQTNFTAGARAQIPWGSGLFLIDSSAAPSSRYGFFIAAHEDDAKGKRIKH